MSGLGIFGEFVVYAFADKMEDFFVAQDLIAHIDPHGDISYAFYAYYILTKLADIV